MVALLLYSLRYAKISITSKANILLKHGFIEYSLRIIFRNNALKRNAAVYADVERTKYVSTYPCRESSSKCVTQMRKHFFPKGNYSIAERNLNANRQYVLTFIDCLTKTTEEVEKMRFSTRGKAGKWGAEVKLFVFYWLL